MPGGSGFEVVEELREWRKDSDARIVVFTNLDLSAEETSRLRRDVEGVVSKGGGGEALLRELGRGRASTSPHVVEHDGSSPIRFMTVGTGSVGNGTYSTPRRLRQPSSS
jgi:DNA-binding NarL/FixJ family response regulator